MFLSSFFMVLSLFRENGSPDNGRVPKWPDKGLLNFGWLVGVNTSGQSRQTKTGTKSSVKLGTEPFQHWNECLGWQQTVNGMKFEQVWQRQRTSLRQFNSSIITDLMDASVKTTWSAAATRQIFIDAASQTRKPLIIWNWFQQHCQRPEADQNEAVNSAKIKNWYIYFIFFYISSF